MTLVRRPNSKFWYVQFQIDGQTYIRSSRTTDRKVALKVEDEWKAKLHAQGFMGRKQRVTFKVAVDGYCRSRLGAPNYKGVVSTSHAVLRLMPTNKYLDDLSSSDLELFRVARVAEGISGQTIKHGLNLIRACLKQARKLGYQVADVEIPSVKLPKHPLRYLSKEDEVSLLRELHPLREGRGLRPLPLRNALLKTQMQDAHDLVVMLLDTGARYSEIANIQWRRIDLETRSIQLWRPKVQNETTLFMSARAIEVLERRQLTRTSEFVFTNKRNGPRGYASVAIRKALRRAGLSDCRIHTLRHTHASRLVQNGMSVYEVRDILGHTDIKTTMRYAHLEQREVASKARDVMNRLNAPVSASAK